MEKNSSLIEKKFRWTTNKTTRSGLSVSQKNFFFLKFADITLERNLVEWRVFLRASVKTFTTDHANSGQHEKINYVRAGLGVTAFIRKSFCHRSLSRAILSRPELENVRSQAAIWLTFVSTFPPIR